MQKKEPIRIAQIIGKMWAGGVESVVFNYYRAMDKSKVQFDFYYDADSTMEPPQDLIDMGARFFKVPPYQQLPTYLRMLKKYFREYHYTIVHSHMNTLSVFPLFVAWSEHIPVRIAHSHSVPGGKEFKRNALKYFLKIFAKVFPTDYFACSEKSGRWMYGDKAFNSGKVVVVNNAINFERFQPKEDEVKLCRKNLGLKNKFVVGHIGRFTYAKNHKFLISIFSEICKIREDAILLLVGDGELHDQIIEELNKKNLMDRTILVGKVLNPEIYYKLINVIILPSVFEGLSLTTVESQIAGVPAVLSDAIPKEAIISNGCVYKKLSEPARAWAVAAMEISETEIILNEKSSDYDITKQAIRLSDWYVAHDEDW